jgi:hypothetical protein
MTDETAPASEFTPPAPAPAASGPADTAPAPPFSASSGSSNPVAGLLDNPKVAETIEQRPEALVGAAFAGGLLFAMILKRLGR